MTDPRTTEIRARRDAATPGPWKLWNGWGPLVNSEPELMACERIGPDPYAGGIAPGRGAVDIYGPRADLELAACAPEDIDYLLGENALLRAALIEERIFLWSDLADAIPTTIPWGSADYDNPRTWSMHSNWFVDRIRSLDDLLDEPVDPDSLPSSPDFDRAIAALNQKEKP